MAAAHGARNNGSSEKNKLASAKRGAGIRHGKSIMMIKRLAANIGRRQAHHGACCALIRRRIKIDEGVSSK